MNVLIDTNVMLDAMLSRSPFSEAAQTIFIWAAEEKIQACITASSVTDIYYLLHKHIHDNERCRQEISKIVMLFKVLDVYGTDCKNALELQMTDYEDALLATCAKRFKMEYIITRNVKDFVGSPVQAILPDDFIQNNSF